MRATLIFILIINAGNVFCQNNGSQSLIRWYSNKEYSALRCFKGDTIYVSCDTLYLINPASYQLYTHVFKNHKTLNSDVKKLTTLYDYTRQVYENRIAEQNEEYDKLKINYDSLVKRSGDFARSTSVQLNDVNNSLSRIDKNITQAQSGISEAKAEIKKEVQNSFKQKLKWGAGGFVIGLAATALVFAITQ